MNPNQVGRNKNPLLSSAVMGGFEGSGIVLTAAEKPVFTIGASGNSDTDNFSDVSLDRDGVPDTHQVESVSFYSPLAELDSMGNLQNASSPPTLDLSQDQQQIDANLNPISAALAQLPSAASTVFSTFSSIIKGSGPHSDQQTTSLVQPMPEPVNPAGYAPSFDPNAPAPSFFSPTDDSLFKKLTIEPATNNTFRLGGNKKKTYAHIPGLSSNQQSQSAQPFAAPNSVMPPMPPQPIQQEPTNHYQDQYQPTSATDMFTSQQREPEKTNKFSLTSLLPSQLLEKIPSTKNLFGSAEPTQSYDNTSFNQNEGFSVMTSNFDQTPQTNLFNSQPDASNAFVGVSPLQQTQQLTQQSINFFTPQQFNTSPFAQPVVQAASVSTELPPPNAFLPLVSGAAFPAPPGLVVYPNQPYAVQQPPSSQHSFNEPPLIEAFSADTNCQPPTFFNPTQASEMFKTNQGEDDKPKNPYSNNRLSRGMGLYKTRQVSAAIQPAVIPPMPEPMTQNMPQLQQTSQHFSSQFQNQIEQPKIPSPPPAVQPSQFEPIREQHKIPTIPTLPPGSFQQPQSYINGSASTQAEALASDFFQSPQQTNFKPYPIPSATPPCADIFNQATSTPIKAVEFQPPEQVSHQTDLQPVNSLFFDSARNSSQFKQEDIVKQPVSKKSDLNVPDLNNDNLSSAANFFQTAPLVPQFENSESSEDSPALNFFKPEPTAPISVMNDSESDKSTVTNFFTNIPTKNSVDQLKINDDTQSVNSFNSLSVQASVYDNTNDFADKLDSLSMMSGNVGSTLSLFATSELDASLAPKPVQFESLVPKFLDEQAASTVRLTASPALSLTKSYRPVYRHWFYQSLYWHPFAMSDSLALDEAMGSGAEIVLTDGGRFEVNLKDRRRSSIYWLSGSNKIRRCSWFYKNPNGSETNLIPFDEPTAEFMEKEYENAVTTATWGHRLQIPNSEDYFMFLDSALIEYHQLGQILVVKRGVDEFVIDDGEEATIDHLIISVSSFGDKIDESADELRSKCMETILHYYSEAYDCGQVGRLEVLPINLNSVDVLKMRETNEVIEDAPGGNADLMKSSKFQDCIMKTAFYANQNYYQKIMNHLAFSLNELVSKFLQRNKEFKGEFSLIATSFEALFLFDLLLNQDTTPELWKLNFKASSFYAFGMPSNLLTIRNATKLQNNFDLKLRRKFLNVVHRLDPIAQRIEPLIKPEFSKLPPESIENQTVDRIDFTIADGSSLESFCLKNYFTSELIILRITNEIYGALKMDSGSL